MSLFGDLDRELTRSAGACDRARTKALDAHYAFGRAREWINAGDLSRALEDFAEADHALTQAWNARSELANALQQCAFFRIGAR